MSWDVFISYSHKRDVELATALQDALHGVARTSWRERAGTRVFRDTTSLAANSDLGGAITAALGNSRYFIYLASPAAAESRWVREEIDYWRRYHSMDTFLIALSDGRIEWDTARRDFDWTATTALPTALAGAFSREPLWVDLREIRRTAAYSMLPGSPFRDRVVTLAAPVHGLGKDELDSKDLHLQLKAARKQRIQLAAVSIFLVLSVVGGVMAVLNANEAHHQATTATARLLGSTAERDSAVDSTRAQLEAVAGFKLEQDPETRAALFRTVSDNPDLVRQFALGAPVSALSAGAGGAVLAGTIDGQLIRWDPATGASTVTRLGKLPVTSISISDDGSVAVATDGHQTALWHPGSALIPLQFDQPGHVAVAPKGGAVAVLTDSSDTTPGLATFDPSTGAQRRSTTLPSGYWGAVGLPDEQTVAVTNGAGPFERLRLTDLTVTVHQDELRSNLGISATSDDGSFVGDTGLWPEVYSTGNAEVTAGYASISGSYVPDVFAIRRDGKRIVMGGGGQLWVSEVSAKLDDNRQIIELLGAGGADQAAFSGSTDRLVTAKGDTLSLWDTTRQPRLRLGADGIAVPDTPRSSVPTQMSVSSDGRRALIVGGQKDVVLQDLTGSPGPGATVTSPEPDVLPAWLPDGTPALIGRTGCGLYALRGGAAERLLEGQGVANLTARLTPDGRSLVCVSEYGGMTVRRVSDGMYVYQASSGRTTALPHGVGNAAISQDGRYAAWIGGGGDADSGQVTLVDSKADRTVTLPGTAQTVDLAGDRLLVTRPDSALDVYDPSGKLLRTVHVGTATAGPLSWVPGTSFVGQLRNDGALIVIDIDNGTVLGTLPSPGRAGTWAERPYEATAVIGVGATGELLTAVPGGSVVRWAVNEKAWLDLACRFAGRDLSPAEWREVTKSAPSGSLSCRG